MRVVKVLYNSPNFNDMHTLYKSKNPKLFDETSTTELFYHFQLALYLNMSLKVESVTYLSDILRKSQDNEADLSLGFPFTDRQACNDHRIYISAHRNRQVHLLRRLASTDSYENDFSPTAISLVPVA
jgi:hypothetical protein